MPLYEGVVVSGIGNFGVWIDKLRDHYTRKTGMVLYPGTLNVRLDQPYFLPATRIRLEGEEYGGRVSVSIVPCTINGRSAFLLRTDANEEERGDHPRTVVEIAADVRLRDHFHLNDGDRVLLDLPV